MIDIISINEDGKILICGLNLIYEKLDEEKSYDIKFELKYNQKDGAEVKNFRKTESKKETEGDCDPRLYGS